MSEMCFARNGSYLLGAILPWSAHPILGYNDDNDGIHIYVMYIVSETQCQHFHMHYLAYSLQIRRLVPLLHWFHEKRKVGGQKQSFLPTVIRVRKSRAGMRTVPLAPEPTLPTPPSSAALSVSDTRLRPLPCECWVTRFPSEH